MMCDIFETTCPDIATFIETSTGRQSAVCRDMATGHAVFHFTNDSEVHALIVAYATDAATVNAKRAFAVRRRLDREIQRVTEEGAA